MHASNAILIFLAFLLVLVGARPLPHGHSPHHMKRSVHYARRSSCPSKLTSTTVAAVPDQTPQSNVAIPGNHTSSSSVNPQPMTSITPTSTSKSKPTASPGASNTGSSLSLDALFPVSNPKESWTTSPLSSNALPLSDSTFNPNHLLSALAHPYVDAPDGKKAMKAHYPKGSYTFSHTPLGGISFYAPGPIDLTKAKEATFGYSVFFGDGFDFQKGGKLPGLYGGNSPETSISCSGGRRSSECFSARLMWRTAGAGELYTYLPPFTDSQFAANKKQCNVPPVSDCNPTYGASVGRGSFTFATGQWTTVSQRVRLNDANQANGELELFANGNSVVKVDGLILRDSDAGKLRGIQMQTFFGGSSPDFASPKDQDVWFSDFSVGITEYL